MFENLSKPAENRRRINVPAAAKRICLDEAGYEICEVCFWEDDGQDDHDADAVRGGPNGALSLKQARLNFLEFGARDRNIVSKDRKPLQQEI